MALLLSTESRKEKKKQQTFFVLLSQAYQSQDLVHHYGNVLEIKNKDWFLQGLKKVH